MFEHGQFFYSLKTNTNARVVVCDQLEVLHNNKYKKQDWYKQLRNRKDVYNSKTVLKCNSEE